MNLENLWKQFCTSVDEQHFEPIFLQTKLRVWAICLRVLKNQDDAEDAFQNAYSRLIALARDSSGPKQEGSIERVVLRLAALESDSLRKRRQRRVIRESVMAFDPISKKASTPEKLSEQELKSIVKAHTDALSDELKLPLQLQYFDGLTQREISEALGVSLGTVNSRIRKAMKLLAPRFQKAGLDRPDKLFPALLPLIAALSVPASLKASSIFTTGFASSLPVLAPSVLAPSSSLLTGSAAIKLAALSGALLVAVFFVSNIFAQVESIPQVVAKPIVQTPVLETPPEIQPVAVAQVAATPEVKPAVLLVQPYRITGTTYEFETGQVIPNATVKLYQWPGPTWRDSAYTKVGKPIATVSSDSAGKFSVGLNSSGRYLIRGITETAQTLDDEGFVFEEVLIEEEATQDVSLYLFQGNTIKGKITDEFTGAPISDVAVRFRKLVLTDEGFHQPVIREGVSNEQGEYIIENVFGEPTSSTRNHKGLDGKTTSATSRIRTANIGIEREGYTSMGTMERPGDSHLSLRIDQPIVEFDFQLRPTHLYHGTVIDAEKNPIQNAEARVYSGPPSFSGASGNRKFLSDENGKFTFEVPHGIGVKLRITSDNHEDFVTEKIKIKKDTKGKTFSLTRKEDLKIFVRVKDETGRLLKANVMFERLDLNLSKQSNRPRSFQISYNTTDSTTGEISVPIENIQHLKVDEVYAVIMSHGYQKFKTENITLEQARNHALIEVVLKKEEIINEEELPWASGKLIGPDGAPLKKALVVEPISKAQATSDDEGGYLIEKIDPEATRLEIQHPDFGRSVIRDVTLNGSYNNLDWKKTNAIAEVTVFDAKTLKPITDFQVTAAMDGAQNVVRDEDRQNVFYIEQSIEDQIKFVITTEQNSPSTVVIEVGENELWIEKTVRMSFFGKVYKDY